MTNQEILSHVDHTLLKAVASWSEINVLCGEAVRCQTASVCVPPSYIERIRAAYPSLCICTVVGFPLGYDRAEGKLAGLVRAAADGADEFDVVVNLGDVKNGDFKRITEELALLKQAAESRILKVIVETCYLTRDEKITLCRCVTEAGADYIKSSTGFGTAGACLEDITLFRENISPAVKIKAAGGIRTREEMERFLNAGCDRIGSSAAVSLLGRGIVA